MMAKEKPDSDRSGKKEKKEKKEKRSDKDGVHKEKKEKKRDKKERSATLEKAADEQLSGTTPVQPATEEDVEMTGESPVVNKKERKERVKLADRPIGALVPFANPLADEKATKKLLKGVNRAAKARAIKRGVKEVVKVLRKSPATKPSEPVIPGIVILAADISPMDVISHIPVLCEDHGVPYIYVQSRAELGAAGSTKRPTSVVYMTEARSKGGKKDADEEKEAELGREWVETYQDMLKLVQKEARNVRI